MPLSALIWTRVKRAKSSFLTTFSVVSFIYLYIIYHSDTIDIHFIIDISYPLFCLSPYSTSVLVRVSSVFSISIHYASAFLVFLTHSCDVFSISVSSCSAKSKNCKRIDGIQTADLLVAVRALYL